MKELGITKEQAKKWFVEKCEHSFEEFVHVGMWGDYGGLNDKSPFYETLADFATESNNELLERYNEAIEVLNIIENFFGNLRNPIPGQDVVQEKIEQITSKAKGE